jgi:putative peptide zinc metalloprotease protein
VPACGLLFILFSPVAFVDVTSSWRFRSKWQRIFTAAAGMYAELFIAAVAVQYWLNAEHGIAKQMCHNLIATASLSTLLFNGNFLMRFDGYYMLSDLLEIQNLYSNGQQYIRYLFRRYLFGIIGSPLPTGAMKPRLTKLYGVASLGWRFSFYCGITFTAATMFHGAGIVIALLIGVGWFLVPALRFVQYLRFGQLGEQPDRRRFVLVVGGVTLGISLILSLPWPGGVVATGVVDYEPLTVVRASAGGFLRNLTCTPGESVAEGEGLAEIENRPVQQELADMNFQLEQSEIRCRSLQSEGDYDLYQIEKGRRDSLREQRDELAAKVAGLRVVAPVAGRVLGRDLESKTGEFMSGGEVILSLGREEHKAIRVAISQRDAEHYLRQRGTTPYVRIKGRGAVLRGAKLDRINPRATRRLPHPALAATNGGPLPVSMNEAETPTSGDHEPELIEPHFQAIITLPAVDAQSLRAGELARVRLGAAGHSIGSHLWTEAERWVSRKLGSG